MTERGRAARSNRTAAASLRPEIPVLLAAAMSLVANEDFQHVDMTKRAGEISAAGLENLMTIVANPRQFKIPDWFLNRKKDYTDGRYSQVHHVHDLIISSGIEVDSVLGSKLVFMYVKCGDMREARRVFDEILVKNNSYIWNLLMSEYAKAGDFRESLSLFQKMQVLGPNSEVRTFSCLLKCFAALRDGRGGEAIHGCVLKLGFDDDIAVGNALIAFYSKCRRISLEIDLFDEMLERSVITWNSIISGWVHNGLSRKGLELFTIMWFLGMDVDMATLVSVIPVCAELGVGVVAQGKVIHGYLIKAGLVHEINLSNSLINMYSKCGDLGEAVRVFEKMGQRSIVSWTMMISGYTCNGQYEEAIALFGAMESEGIEPDLFVITSVLHACACSGSLDQGKYNHHQIIRRGMESSVFVANTLMDMYAKSACMEAARSVFDCKYIYAEAQKWEGVKKIRERIGNRGLRKNPGCSWVEIRGRVNVFVVGSKSRPQSKRI